MRHRYSKTERGYTLTEILVAVAIFAIIFVAALVAYDRANRIFKSSVDASDVQQTTRVAFDRLVAEVRMAGFDFDRDGYPTGSKKYQQPDEQLEFIHPHALTIRTNLNYETGTDNGRETAYEPGFGTATTDDDFFPVVTTANNEIITYVLKSDSGPNDDTITFWADVARPRRTYPDTGGANETQVQITGVDLCQDAGGTLTGCLNPPYTLYRIALKDDGTPDTPVPIANNIRSMTFSYFVDGLSTVALTPNGGTGQFIVTGGSTPAASITARELRGSVRSIRFNLVGMSPGTDAAYVDPIEQALPLAQQVAAARRHRQYSLQSTIVPRNLGKRGVQEIDINVPGSPLVTQACHGGCGVALVKWDAPPIGYVDSYAVVYDTNAGGAYNSPVTDAGRNLFAYVDGLTPGQTYYFKVVAKNAFGSGISINYGGPVTIVNRTQPEAPTIVSVSGNPSGPAAVANDIQVIWEAPVDNMNPSSAGTVPTWSCGDPADQIPSKKEVTGYEIHRSTSAGFTPSASTKVWDGYLGTPGAPVLDSPSSGLLTFTDTTPKLACTTYYYKIRAYERCKDNIAWNQPGNTDLAVSDWSNELEGQSSVGAPPKAPANAAATIASTCSTNPCSISLEWDEVVQDTNDRPILVAEYTVLRRTFDGGAHQAGLDVTMPVTDPDPGAGNRVTFTDTTAPQPPFGRIYHYRIAARQCGGTSTGAYSSPDVKFPCAITNTYIESSPVLEGDGSAASPWLIGETDATLRVTSNTALDLAASTARVYSHPGRVLVANPPLTPAGTNEVLVNHTMAGANGVFEFEIQLTDALGCGTTITRFVQESPTGCCILPYKDSSGLVFDSTVLTHTAGTAQLRLTFKNQCDVALALNSLRLSWNTTSPRNDLESVTWPASTGTGTVTQTFSPALAPLPTTLTPPAGALTSIAGSSTTYAVTLTFSRANRTDVNLIPSFCVNYTRAGNVTVENCQVVVAGATCP